MESHGELHLGMSLFAAFVLGALHVLEPAHGRSIVTAVAVGFTGTRKVALRYAAIVTVSHVFTTLLLAIGVALFGRFVDLGGAMALVKALAALATIYFGARMFLHSAREGEACHCPMHTEDERAVLGLGLAGGAIPCYGSLALVTVAVASGSFGAAVPLVLTFAAGLGATLLFAALISSQIAGVLQARMDRIFRYAGHVAGSAVVVAGVVSLVLVVVSAFGGGASH